MNKRNIFWYLSVLAIILFATSCKKYLDEKPNKQLYVPNNWQDLQALLDNNALMNMASTTTLVELISDNIYVKDQRWNSVTPDLQGAYIWDDKASQYSSAWSSPYECIYYSNIVLDNLDKVKAKSPQNEVNNIEGSALFYRSFAFFHLLQLYAKPYSSSTQAEFGIVLKLTGSITDKVTRGTINEAYQKVISDLQKSLELLPENSPNVMRPSKAAVNALLARIYLSMSDYENALKAAELAILQRPNLLDYNELLPNSSPVMISFLNNPEIIFMNVLQNNGLTTSSYAIVDSVLYSMYSDNDIRKKLFFITSSAGGPGTYRFRGSYYNLSAASGFHGLATDEIYLILSECLVRKGKINDGLKILNELLIRRYKSGSFLGYNDLTQDEAMEVIINERRKELLFRGIRWSDIRRLNMEGKNIELRRVLNGKTYVLPSNDLRSILLIPTEEILRSGIPQNPR